MAAFEVIALDTATPQLRAPGASDTYTFPRAVELPLGTANGVLYLNGSKVVTSGSALTFDGTKAISFGDGSSATLTVPYSTNGNTFTVKHGAGSDTRLVFTSSGFASSNSVSFETWNGSAYNSIALSGANTAIFTLAGSEQMRLTSTGLGIGTSSPGAKLAVNVGGSAVGVRVDGVAGQNQDFYAVRSGSATIQAGPNITFQNPAGGTTYSTTMQMGPTGELLFFNYNGSAWNERMRLDSSGNLGLGVTPSAWDVGKAFEVGAVGNGLWTVGNSNIYLVANTYYASGAYRYASSTFASAYEQENGVHKWRTAPSGTAGNAISFSQVMTLTAAGGLNVGATTDPGAGIIRGTGLNGWTSIGDGVVATNRSDGMYLIQQANTAMLFYTNNTERARITSVGNFKIGGSADRATTEGTNQLVLFNGTAPVGTLANGVSFYSASGEANVMDAAGNATLLSPHDAETNEWIFRSKHTPTGKVLKIDVERLLKFVNDHFGLDAVHEFVEV